MQKILIKTLPVVEFAHVYSAPSYSNILPARPAQIEISYIAEGSCKIALPDGSERILNQYDISCNLRKLDQKISANGYHKHHTVCFNVDFDEVTNDMEGSISLPDVVRAGEYVNVHKIIDEIIRARTMSRERGILLSSLVLRLLDEINILSSVDGAKGRDILSPYVIRAKQYVLSNLDAPITQQAVAKALNITPEYLCAVFKAGTGKTFIRFVNEAKLARVRALMDREGMSLKSASTACGYNDPNYVSRLYKKYFGKNVTDSSQKRINGNDDLA